MFKAIATLESISPYRQGIGTKLRKADVAGENARDQRGLSVHPPDGLQELPKRGG